MLKNIIKSTLGLLLAGGFCNELSAQDKVVDQIVAIVGSNPILKSDIETQAMQMRQASQRQQQMRQQYSLTLLRQPPYI